jgi:phosphatidate cytidylyltransferase
VAKVATAGVSVPDAGLGALWRRLASSAVLIPAFVGIVVLPPAWVFQTFVVVVSALACHELARLLERAGRPVHTRLAVGVGAAVTAAFATALYGVARPDGTREGWAPTPELVLALGAAVILSAPLVGAGRPDATRTAHTLLPVIYVGWLLGYAIWLHGRPGGPALVLFLGGVTWAGESAAYLAGSAIGRRPLAPVLSPRKTIEGSVVQALVSVLAAWALGAALLPACGGALAAGAGVLLGVIGQAGDLAESAIKRSAGVKDTSALIPGHGGMLDRVDSLLFNAPAFYFYSLYSGCHA